MSNMIYSEEQIQTSMQDCISILYKRPVLLQETTKLITKMKVIHVDIQSKR